MLLYKGATEPRTMRLSVAMELRPARTASSERYAHGRARPQRSDADSVGLGSVQEVRESAALDRTSVSRGVCVLAGRPMVCGEALDSRAHQKLHLLIRRNVIDSLSDHVGLTYISVQLFLCSDAEDASTCKSCLFTPGWA
jgi:hypothetical protein